MSVRPVLFVYKEVVAGDLRKLVAESNDSKTGGGARDLRLPWKTFRSIMHRIFTEDGVGRGGKQIRVARVTYLDKNEVAQTTELEYWPPTSSRPTEDRISRIHASPALGGQLPKTDQGRVFVVFSKFDDGTVRCDYAYESALGEWAIEVSSQIVACMASAAARDGNRTVQGYYDFVKGSGYCHAD
ncbi:MULTISPECIES: hypothetical protein [Actinomycetes]|uniref:hypothetical protein n=1 Tax=Actinomycetes TaxID=1760 RepID=UPI0004C00AA2|nr:MULTISPECIES: hypothetical protein [Actinomycetes]MCK0515933.1 hypothetical protein [Williamsia sp. DF01-3]